MDDHNIQVLVGNFLLVGRKWIFPKALMATASFAMPIVELAVMHGF